MQDSVAHATTSHPVKIRPLQVTKLDSLSQPLSPTYIIKFFVFACPPSHWFSAECSHGSPFCCHRVCTPVPPFPHPQSPSFCRSQLAPPSHNLVIPLAIVSIRQFCCKKTELIWFFRGFEPELQRWQLGRGGRYNDHSFIHRRTAKSSIF